MLARFFWLLVAGMLAAGTQAIAATNAVYGDDPEITEARSSEHVQLAQGTPVDIYYDQYGREILVDPWTGRIVGIVEPREAPRYREPWGWEERGYYRDDPYYLDERALRSRERRERRMRELGRLEEPRGWPEYRDPYYEDDHYRGEGQWREPEPRDRDQDSARAVPEPVERRPLEDTARLEEPSDRAPSETIIEIEPEEQALPDATITPPTLSGASEDVAKIQVVLDRIGAAPGVIDGRIGDNVNKAIAAYRDLTGRPLRTYDREAIEALLEETGGPAFTTYEITAADAAGRFVASIPSDFGEKARMEWLGYTSVAEKLAERFHMDERYLRALNPDADFDRPGTRITVANVKRPQRADVVRIVADKSAKQVRGYGQDGRLVVTYPATIGSTATPSPTGTHTVERIAFDPEYTYNPRLNFQQGDNDRILTIPPGPNGPVGSVWIALSKPTYGIHGTPEPSQIGRTYSNGCIRLTNWDAQELARLIKPGVSVEFVQ